MVSSAKTLNHKNCRQPSFVGMCSRMEKPSSHSDSPQMCVTMTSGICRSLAISSLLPQCTFVFVGFPLMGVWGRVPSQKRVFVLSLTVFVAVQNISLKIYLNFSGALRESAFDGVRFWLSVYYLLISFKMVVKLFIRTSNLRSFNSS